MKRRRQGGLYPLGYALRRAGTKSIPDIEHGRGTMNTAKLQRTSRTHEEGFTLIELLIVMSVMLVLMTLGIPQLLKLRKSANENSAIQSLRTIEQAELSYNSAYQANGFACTLPALGGDPKSGAPSAQSAQLIENALATGQKAGYTFAVTNCNKVTINNQDQYTSFEITAVPQAVGKTGDRGFCADENNVIRYDPAGGTNCTQPIQ
jgi:type IV pilus assembly protein PilA